MVQAVIDVTDEMAPGLGAAERARVHRHFRNTSRYEWMFWDMGYRQERWPAVASRTATGMASLLSGTGKTPEWDVPAEVTDLPPRGHVPLRRSRSKFSTLV